MKDLKRTPMLQQYWTAKESLDEGHLLFFRLGDFYEMFYDDAIIASKLLNLTLTQRGDIPMCGVPAHTLDNYIKKLLSHGCKLAICDQTSPVQKGSLVQREIVECITPGTISNSIYLDTKDYNFLIALYYKDGAVYCAWVDISTADMFVDKKSHSLEELKNLLHHIQAREILFADSQEELLWLDQLRQELHVPFTRIRDWHFSTQSSFEALKKLLHIHTLAAYNFTPESDELFVISALLNYVNTSSKKELTFLNSLNILEHKNFLEIDTTARYNLELFSSMRENKREHSLIGILDQCHTAMGSRELSKYLSYPLVSKQAIEYRQEKIKILISHRSLTKVLDDLLSQIHDIPRTLSRIANQKAHAKDMVSIRASLSSSISIYQEIETFSKEYSNNSLLTLFHVELIKKNVLLYQYLQDSIVENPPIQFGQDRIIQEGFDEKLDGLRDIYENQHKILNEYLEREQQNVEISLKLKYNGSIGYFFELTPTQLSQCPKHFILRQSLTKQRRYKTETLIELESEIFQAETTLFEYEEQLFDTLRRYVKNQAHDLTSLSRIIAELDVLVSLANVAHERNYVCPEIVEDDFMEIEEGRHAVIESFMPQGNFISNNLTLHKDSQSFIMLTGPNMSGKSTYLRQNALIVILAQIGSFVPARVAKIGIRDKVFCRVGASDNLVKGESTFLVEMGESAFILQNASPKSLVIMDEIGRGTSVTDGEAIAQAIAEYFIEHNIFTLFATHYHNLTDMSYPQMKNLTLSIEQDEDTIVFTRHIQEGALKNSYGLEVAKIAGIPKLVLERAKLLLSKRVQKDSEINGTFISEKSLPDTSVEHKDTEESTQKLISQKNFTSLITFINNIQDLDINQLTPLEALELLDRYNKESKHLLD